jgi:predicted DNA-binding transcriptional regulator AlpA
MKEIETATHLLTECQVAERLGISLGTIRRYRMLQRGPKFKKLGVLVRYAPSDVEAWLNSRPTGGEQLVEKEIY